VGTAYLLDSFNEFKLERRSSVDEDMVIIEFEAKDEKTRSSSFAFETSFTKTTFEEEDHGYHTV
jgi:hypothetical protein